MLDARVDGLVIRCRGVVDECLERRGQFVEAAVAAGDIAVAIEPDGDGHRSVWADLPFILAVEAQAVHATAARRPTLRKLWV